VPYLAPLAIYLCSRFVIFLGVGFGKIYISLGNDTWLGGDRWYHSLLRWDSEWYKIIASEGYSYNGDPGLTQTVVFYPLYPLLSRILSEILRIDVIDSMLLVSNLAAAAAILLLFKLTRQQFNDRVALVTVAMISFFPLSVFLSAGYTEPLALLWMVSFFLAISGKRYLTAAVLAGLALATRSSGIVLVPVLLWELWLDRSPRRFLMEAVPLAIVATSGLWLYIAYLGFTFHHPMAFSDGQAAFHGNTTMIHRLISALTLQPFAKMDFTDVSPAGLDQWFTLIFMALVACSWFAGLNRGMTLFAFSLLALPYLTLAGGPAGFTSMGRFNIVSFPLFVVMALLMERQQWMIPGIIGISGSLLLIYTALFAQWQWIG
jgi:4-amino-4-deoxy-L-arabinose transferase-like glycosyltransferase